MLSESASQDKSKLAMAAEELAKAAIDSTNVTTLAMGKETVEILKKLSIGSSLIEKSVESLKTSLDSKLNTLNQSITKMKEEVAGLKSIFNEKAKNQELQWALSNVGVIDTFYFYAKSESGRRDSSSFIKEILLTFRQGSGRYIYDLSMTQYGSYGNNVEKGEEQFRDQLSTNIHKLLGRKPLISADTKGYAIYYS